ncbi:MAG: hypothetical protein ACP5N3_02570 [Candidatus Nanoarchaeia archaeon]
MNKLQALKIYEKRIPFSKGKRGLISFALDEKNEKFSLRKNNSLVYKDIPHFINNKKYCIKEKNPSSDANNRIFLEYENNKKLNEINVGPEIYFYDEEKDFLIRDFVEGKNIFDWIKENKKDKEIKNNLKKIILNILDQCRLMDKIKMNKLEMTNPHKDIIIDHKNEPFIIDFERCRFAARPKNVTQFCQFLTKGNMKTELEELRIFLDKDKLMTLAEEYKNSKTDKESDDNYKKIKEEIKA